MTSWMIEAVAEATTSQADTSQRRSAGYAGSIPLGHDGALAFDGVDCARINRDVRRSVMRVGLSSQCVIDLVSPDRRTHAISEPYADGEFIRIRVGRSIIVSNLEQPVTFLWSPRSDAFALNDGRGSGQTSRLRYFARIQGRWQENDRLDRSAAATFLKRYKCRGHEAYANVSAWRWKRNGLLRVIVQEGVHSSGCIQPHRNRNVMLDVIGVPSTGHLVSAREVRTLR